MTTEDLIGEGIFRNLNHEVKSSPLFSSCCILLHVCQQQQQQRQQRLLCWLVIVIKKTIKQRSFVSLEGIHSWALMRLLISFFFYIYMQKTKQACICIHYINIDVFLSIRCDLHVLSFKYSGVPKGSNSGKLAFYSIKSCLLFWTYNSRSSI